MVAAESGADCALYSTSKPVTEPVGVSQLTSSVPSPATTCVMLGAPGGAASAQSLPIRTTTSVFASHPSPWPLLKMTPCEPRGRLFIGTDIDPLQKLSARNAVLLPLSKFTCKPPLNGLKRIVLKWYCVPPTVTLLSDSRLSQSALLEQPTAVPPPPGRNVACHRVPAGSAARGVPVAKTQALFSASPAPVYALSRTR